MYAEGMGLFVIMIALFAVPVLSELLKSVSGKVWETLSLLAQRFSFLTIFAATY
jgi:hypothetical protein